MLSSPLGHGVCATLDRGQAAAQTSGSGIGLAIAAEVTLAHGGTLTAASEPGAGARLTVTLPAP